MVYNSIKENKMKNIKTVLVICLTLISFSLIMGDVRTDVNIQGGGITSDSLTFGRVWGTFGTNFDIVFSDLFFISPELYIIVIDWGFKNVYLTPGLTANIKFKDLFIGAGFVKMISLRETDIENLVPTDNMKLKLAAGIRSPRFVLTIFGLMDTSSIFKNMDIGFTMGFTF
jgi:hypothetical protein